ncbi:MAG TPA: hypothetical protein VF898_11810 [Chloroflexota bacterium]
MAETAYYDPHEALLQFQSRMMEIREQLSTVNRGLGSQDLLILAAQTRELIRRTRGLLDGNIQILFHDQPDRVPEELYRHLEFATGHLNKALGDEYEFDIIKKRLYMANSLASYVIRAIEEAIARLT